MRAVGKTLGGHLKAGALNERTLLSAGRSFRYSPRFTLIGSLIKHSDILATLTAVRTGSTSYGYSSTMTFALSDFRLTVKLRSKGSLFGGKNSSNPIDTSSPTSSRTG